MGVGAPNRGMNGPLHNKDFGGFDRPRGLFSNMPIGPDAHLNWSSVYDDFTNSAINTTNDWISIKDASATVALNSEENGAVLLSSQATTDNDGASIQRTICPFLVKANKKLIFEARVKVSVAADCDMFIGLAETFITNPEGVVVDGIARVGFELVDGSAILQAVIDNDTAATRTSTTISAVDATYVRLGFRVDGGHVRFYVNRTLTNSIAIPSAIAAKALCPAFFGLSGSATGTHTRAMDYVFAMQERT